MEYLPVQSPRPAKQKTLVLVVDSDMDQATRTRGCLESYGYEVECVELAAAVPALATYSPSVLVVNLASDEFACAALPGLRRSTAAGIIGYPALHRDLAVALRLGADDCQTDAISCDELAARIEALLRCLGKRLAKPESHTDVIETGQLRIYTRGIRVEVDERPVHLTRTEFRVLECLASRTGQNVDRKELSMHIWGVCSDDGTDDHTVQVHVGRLRKKLKSAGLCNPQLETRHGLGYGFVLTAAGSQN